MVTKTFVYKREQYHHVTFERFLSFNKVYAQLTLNKVVDFGLSSKDYALGSQLRTYFVDMLLIGLYFIYSACTICRFFVSYAYNRCEGLERISGLGYRSTYYTHTRDWRDLRWPINFDPVPECRD